MKIIDAHINITKNGKWFDTKHDSSLSNALKQIKKKKISNAVLVSPAVNDFNKFNFKTVTNNPLFYTGYSLMDNSDKSLKKLNNEKINQIKFLKIHPRSSLIDPLDKNNEKFFKWAVKYDKPIIFCGYIRGNNIPLKNLEPFVYDLISKKWPNLKLIISHCGSYRPMDALAVAQSNKNVFLDLSHVLMYFKGSSLINDFKFIIDKLDQKVIYGSDFPEYPIDDYLNYTLHITKNIKKNKLENFFYNNAKKIFKI